MDREEDDIDIVSVLVKRPVPLRDLERVAIEAAMIAANDNVTHACNSLGIGRTTLYRKLKRYGIQRQVA